MSKLEVNTIAPQSGTTVTLGESGDTINVASGATAGTGFGATLTGSTNNTVVTVTGANAMQGESNLTWDGSSLGVGRASPETTAHIQSASGECELRLTAASTSDARLRFGDTTTTAAGYIGYNRSTQNMYFRAANSGAATMQQDSTGDLKINSSVTGLNSKVVIGFGATQRGMLLYDYNNGSGTTFIQFRNGSSGATLLGEITRNGSNNSVNYNTTSDYRLKTNIEDKIDGIEKVKQLNVKRFNWLDNIDVDKVDGFLAHEVSSVVPEAITGEKDAVDEKGNIIPQGIDQSKLVPLLTSALQEAITKIETLEAENTDIKARLTALENA